MKLSGIVSTLAVAASFTDAAPAAGQLKRYAVGYDALKTGTPALIGGKVKPIFKFFKGLKYAEGPLSKEWGLVKLGGELLPALNPASAPNVLVSKAKEAGTRAGTIDRANSGDRLDIDRLSFACAIDNLGESIPVACTVAFIGAGNNELGIDQVKEANYGGGNNMQKVNLDFSNIRNIAFVVKSAEDLGLPVVLLLDSLYYNVTTKA